MTNEEAIENIELAIAEVEWNYPLDISIALGTAIEALKKQIAKKPIKQNKYYFNCPFCKKVLDIEQEDMSIYGMIPPNYCENCGQALDWSKTDD